MSCLCEVVERRVQQSDVWEVIPLCPFPQNSAHTDMAAHHSLWHEPPWPVTASQSHRCTRDDSWTTVPVMARQCRNTYTKILAVYISTPAGPLDQSFCLRTRRSKGLVTWQWSHTDALESTVWSTCPSSTIPLIPLLVWDSLKFPLSL